MMRRVIQFYMTPALSKRLQPGFGDFLKGCCTLFENLRGSGIELRLDISRSDYSRWICFDPETFCVSEADPSEIEECYEPDEHLSLAARLEQFKHQQSAEFVVSTNWGDWSRRTLDEDARAFMRRCFAFVPAVTEASAPIKGEGAYEVLHIRCGDRFFNDRTGLPDDAARNRLYSIIERQIIPTAGAPLVIMSDSLALKNELCERYGFRASLLLPEHLAFGGNAFSTCVEVDLLRHSSRNHHINLCYDWWSGFSHFTSLIFSIPSVNWRYPVFAREFVPADGRDSVETSAPALLAHIRELQRLLAEEENALAETFQELNALQRVMMLKSRIDHLMNRWTWLGWRLMPWTKPSWCHHPLDE